MLVRHQERNMQVSPSISFRGMKSSPALESFLLEKVQELERFYPRITSCKIVVYRSDRHRQKGKVFVVGIDLIVPGGEIVVSREVHRDHTHEDAMGAIREAFREARRMLEDHQRKHADHRHQHPPLCTQGEVVRVFPDEGYGFIEIFNGSEVYFRLNLISAYQWKKIDIGAKVGLMVAEGDAGPFAQKVVVL